MQAQIKSFVIHGAKAKPVTVNAEINPGLPAFSITGMPDTAVREARERVRAAILNCGFEFPQKRITISIEGSGDTTARSGPPLDVPIAYALLLATKQLEESDVANFAAIGELSLDGAIQPIRGTLPISQAATKEGVGLLAVPYANDRESRIDTHPPIFPARRLDDFRDIKPTRAQKAATESAYAVNGPDLKDLRGHAFAIRALEIAAAGGHSILLRGSPGCGKTMLARRLASILPPMTEEEAISVTGLQSIAGSLRIDGVAPNRPFRAPHHSISSAGLTGGGASLMPGEMTLATHGVLFLDELSEFSTRTLETLTEPMRTNKIAVTRGNETHVWPANFQLVAATNPCPCGGTRDKCRCSAKEIARFNRRISGPLLDAFDMSCAITRPTPADVEAGPVTDSETVRAHTVAARKIQTERYAERPYSTNAELDGATTRRLLKPPDECREMLNDGYKRQTIGLREYDRTLRIARTIADLEQSEHITEAHISEALAFRLASLN